MDQAVSAPRFLPSTVLRLLGAVAITFLGSLGVIHLMQDGFLPLAAMVTAISVFLVIVLLKKSLTPYRWLATGLVLTVLFTVFPILYTVFLSFTNMSGGHLLTKQQAIARLEAESYTPEGAPVWAWEAYQAPDKSFRLLLTSADGSRTLARSGQEPTFVEGTGDAPAELDGALLLDPIAKVQSVQELSSLRFGTSASPITIVDLSTAAHQQSRYLYDPAADTMTDIETHTVYTPQGGTFRAATGEELIPGFMVGTGLDNYSRFLGNPGYLSPILAMILWNIAFSLLSVLLAFGVGMVIALMFENLPGKRLIRALLILPYPVPVLVSLMVWRGLLNENMGLVTTFLTQIFGSAPAFFTDAGWAKFAVILINVYLSYPYFYILCSGALKSIPTDIYEAAAIDGASSWVVLRSITMPLLMRILMPLLIASFSFNFNNFTIIWGFNAGLPAMADTIVPMGHTDLLISFIYRLGFSSANAADYGFSAAITVLLFVFVGLMVFFQTRKAASLKETT